MNINKPIYKPSTIEASIITALIILIISVGIIRLEAIPHIPILFSIIFLLLYGMLKKVAFHNLESGMIKGASSGIGAIFILFLIGFLIASWVISGTIPTLIYSGFLIVTPKYFYAVVFLVTAIVGVGIGSSLTTVATVGVAFIGIGESLDLSLPIIAGAIVSGAFFGDKMSPLSDTTNLASTILKVDLFEHIRNMGWTTIPALIFSVILFALLSPTIGTSEFTNINRIQTNLFNTGFVHWYSWIPLLMIIIFSIRRTSALISLIFSSFAGICLAFFNMELNFSDLLTILYSGFVSNTGNAAIDSLLTRGGIESMFFTISLVLLALSLGGLLFTLGITQCLLQSIEKWLNSIASVITVSALTAIGMNVVIGEQYLSILLTGETFQSTYEKLGLARKNLSRVLEDAGTVVNPLVPWSVCGVFITSVLGVNTLEYLPFTFFCLLSPLLTIFYGLTGKTLTFIPGEKTKNRNFVKP